MASGMEAAGRYPTTNITTAGANEAAIAAADRGAIVVADDARAGRHQHINGSSSQSCIHTCIHAYMHTYIHAYMHTHTCIHAYIHAYMHTCMYIRIHAYTHIRMYAWHVCMYACMHVRMHACMHVCTYACMHIYARMHTCIHAHVHVHVYVCMYTRMYVRMYVCMCTQTCTRRDDDEPTSTICSARSCTSIGRFFEDECALPADRPLRTVSLRDLGSGPVGERVVCFDRQVQGTSTNGAPPPTAQIEN